VCQKLRWLGAAGVLRQGVDVIRGFVKHLARRQRHEFPAFDLHVDLTVEHVRVGIVAMRGRFLPRREVDLAHEDFLVVRQRWQWDVEQLRLGRTCEWIEP